MTALLFLLMIVHLFERKPDHPKPEYISFALASQIAAPAF
jgi:hypothetical protein